MANFAVILVAAGKSVRFSEGQSKTGSSLMQKKPFVLLKGRAVWLYSVLHFMQCKDVRQIIIVISPEDRKEFERVFAVQISEFSIDIIDGGSERFESVGNALNVVRNDIDYIAIHDAARPCITDKLIESVFTAVRQYGAVIPAVPLYGTIKRAIPTGNSESVFVRKSINELKTERVVQETVSRKNLWEAQTPQVFQKDLYLRAWQERGELMPTDDSQLVENIGEMVYIVPSDNMNLKITTPQDLLRAEKYLDIIAKQG